MRLTHAARIVALVVCASLTTIAATGDVRLIDAVKAGNAATVRTLAKQRALVNATEADGTTALHWAVRNDDAQSVDTLLRAGAKAKAANRYAVTPLALASTN